MRAYPYVQIGLVICVLIAVSAALVVPQDAMARDPEYEIVTNDRGGGTSGGGEWKTGGEEQSELPIDLEGNRGGGGPAYSEPRKNADEDSWTEAVNAMVIRMVRFLGAKFSELF
jgi:hypothetical protein